MPSDMHDDHAVAVTTHTDLRGHAPDWAHLRPGTWFYVTKSNMLMQYTIRIT
jgi:hypothetical protein